MNDSTIAAYMPLFALIVTLSLIITTAVLAFTGKMIPDEIKTGDGLAFAWFFLSSAIRGTTPRPPTNGGSA